MLIFIVMVMPFNIAVYPDKLNVKGFGNAFNIGDEIRVSCEVPRIRPVPLAIYWLYNRTRVHRGRVSSKMNTGLKDYQIISTLHFTLTAKDQGCSLICVVVTDHGIFESQEKNVILKNPINSKWCYAADNVNHHEVA